jgi:hypothetical protein
MGKQVKICGMVVPPPDRAVASRRAAEPWGASISVKLTPLSRNSFTARVQNGQKNWVYISTLAMSSFTYASATITQEC